MTRFMLPLFLLLASLAPAQVPRTFTDGPLTVELIGPGPTCPPFLDQNLCGEKRQVVYAAVKTTDATVNQFRATITYTLAADPETVVTSPLVTCPATDGTGFLMFVFPADAKLTGINVDAVQVKQQSSLTIQP